MVRNYLSATVAGSKLTKQAAIELEQKVSINPDDELSRITLMGYYPVRAIWNREDREKCITHELWFVQNNPSHPELRYPHCSVEACIDKDLYELMKSAWLEHVHQDCKNVTILSHAAAFFTRWDQEFSTQLIERARNLEPTNKELLKDLAHVYSLGLIGKHDEIWLRRAFEVHKELTDAEPNDLKQLAKFSVIVLKIGDTEAAKQAAQKILATNPAPGPSVLHGAHTVLGQSYLKEGNIEAAKRELQATGTWPEFDLNNELIAIGERKVVCSHLWKSMSAWKAGRIQLLIWILQLILGGKPKLSRTWLLSSEIGGYANETLA